MTRMEEIYKAVLPEMAAHDIEDTTENRIVFLSGLRDGWREDDDEVTDPLMALDKALYLTSLELEIFLLGIKLRRRS